MQYDIMRAVVTSVSTMCNARSAALVALVLAGCSLSSPKDAASRVEAAPGESLEAVRDRVRALPAEAKVRGVEVVIPPGEYFLPDGMVFAEGDGGASMSARVVWRAKKPGEVRRSRVQAPRRGASVLPSRTRRTCHALSGLCRFAVKAWRFRQD